MKHNFQNFPLSKIKRAINKDHYHVFFISNPIFEMISVMWIKECNINLEKVLFINLREINTNIINCRRIIINNSLICRILEKFGINLNLLKIKKFLKLNKKKFIIYAPWQIELVRYLINNKKCIGHFYIEEGQLSSWKKNLITNTKNEFINDSNGSTYAEDKDFLHRNDALGFLSIDKNTFPHISNKKKFILNNFEDIKNIYKPKLIGVNIIGIMPASRRIKGKKLLDIIFNLVDYLPNKSAIKLHPAYCISNKNKRFIEKSIFDKKGKQILICDSDILLEAEMLFEKKVIYGSKSSLQKYSEMFYSTFIKIDLY